ncbi:MAG: Lrp/AsnC family transcriptional regulator [Candidatus Thorarchaeota archaeon]|jgi:DNA-binding Lrp family transcriptional regulator
MAEKFTDSKLDATDIKLLGLLQQDSKMSNAELAKEAGRSITRVHTRVKNLQSRKIINKFTAVLDPKKLDRETLAFILVTVRYRVPGKVKVLSQREFCQTIAQHHQVQGVHVLSGEYDVLLKVRAKNIDAMNRFIVDYLRELPEVDKTLTMFAMDSYLDTLELRGIEKVMEKIKKGKPKLKG